MTSTGGAGKRPTARWPAAVATITLALAASTMPTLVLA